MTIADWIQANSVWIAFGVTIVVLVYYIIKTIETFKKRRRTITALAFILTVWGLLFFYYVAFVGSRIEPTGWGEIILLAGLVSVTAAYAYSTEKMAEEMREQRYGTVRPVIYIKPMEPQPMSLNIEEVTNKEREEAEYLSGLLCTLHNVGIGPAIDVYSFTLTVGGERIQEDFGILTTKGETTPDVLLSPERRDEQWFLVAYYRDIYDRCFESRREISLDKEKNVWRIGPLKTVLAKKSKPK